MRLLESPVLLGQGTVLLCPECQLLAGACSSSSSSSSSSSVSTSSGGSRSSYSIGNTTRSSRSCRGPVGGAGDLLHERPVPRFVPVAPGGSGGEPECQRALREAAIHASGPFCCCMATAKLCYESPLQQYVCFSLLSCWSSCLHAFEHSCATALTTP